MRASLLVVLLSGSAWAWGPIGINDAGCLVWDYDEVVDGGLTQLPDGGFAGPGGLCIELVEVTGDHLRKKKDEPFDGPTTPEPPSTWTPVGIPSQDGGSRPLTPFDPNADLPHPFLVCGDGQGWSFESGTWEGWTPTGVLDSPGRTSPVFGNNVHIDRLRPPGYQLTGNDAGMDVTIGGDYWRFSRDVNQQGDYWIGTRDRRKDWTVFPGQTFPETSTSGLYSPVFIIGTDYLDFFLGGGVHASQRVELQIQPQAGWTQAQLLAAFDGIGVAEFPPDYASLNKLDGTWVVVRASSPRTQDNGENDFMGHRVAWNVKDFKFLSARLRIVDQTRSTAGLAHVNADHFRCTNTLDPKHAWTLKPNLQVSKVGHAVYPQPLWGATDLHSHAVANVSFGGHLIWGDVSDPLSAVYNCDAPLPAITRADGGVLRPAITTPDLQTDCYVNFGIVLLMNVAANAACVAMSAGLAAIPFAGPILAAEEIAVCTTAVAAATVGLLSSPVMTNYSLHGAESPTSGGLELGDWLEAVAKLISGEELHVHGVIETLDPDLPDGTHSGHFGRLHQQYQHQMVMRAWQGGLRLVVLDSINGRAMHALLDQEYGAKAYDDWQAVRDSVIAARRLTACAGDTVFKPGPLCGIAEIARTPAHARRIIANNRVAIVLGTEIDELGKPRSDKMMKLFNRSGETDSLEKQVEDLFAWGIRKVTPIHGIDNPLGGTAIFNDIYPTSQQYHNLTRALAGGTAGTWQDWYPGADFALPASLVDPLAGMVIGTFTPGAKLGANPGLANNGLPVVETVTPSETTIGGYDGITFRYGMASGAYPLARFAGNYELGNVSVVTSKWIPMKYWGLETTADKDARSPLLSLLKMNNLGWILGADPGGLGSTSRCSLEDAHLPLPFDFAEIAPASDNYDNAALGHFNARGLTADGVTFAQALMKKGMAVDFDHLSQKARLDGYATAHTFAQQAAASSDYATMGVHTNFRGVEKSGPVPLEYRDDLGVGSEADRTAAELTLQRSHGGVVSVAVTAALVPTSNLGSANNNCDFSSKAWVQKYLAFMNQLKGRGIGMSTDMNGLTTPMASRFGFGACHTDRVSENALQGDSKQVQNWPRDFTTAAQGCLFNTRQPGSQWNANCPSTKMVVDQHQEASGVVYDDYSGRVVATLNASPAVVRVLARGANEVRDDFGPRPHHDELVTVGASRQLFPLKKFKNGGAGNNTGWDFNLDGLKHIGMYPDFFQDVRNGGLTFEQLTPLFNAAEEYVQMWEKNCAMATGWAQANGGTAPQCTGTGPAWPSF